MEIYREDDTAGDQKSQKHPVYIYSDRDADGALASGRDDSCNHLLYDSSDKTIYFERMMFCFEIPTIYEDIAGNRLNLTIGGVRAYNHMNLYSKKGAEKFKVFIGFKNLVCCNMCVSTDGY